MSSENEERKRSSTMQKEIVCQQVLACREGRRPGRVGTRSSSRDQSLGNQNTAVGREENECVSITIMMLQLMVETCDLCRRLRLARLVGYDSWTSVMKVPC